MVIGSKARGVAGGVAAEMKGMVVVMAAAVVLSPGKGRVVVAVVVAVMVVVVVLLLAVPGGGERVGRRRCEVASVCRASDVGVILGPRFARRWPPSSDLDRISMASSAEIKIAGGLISGPISGPISGLISGPISGLISGLISDDLAERLRTTHSLNAVGS